MKKFVIPLLTLFMISCNQNSLKYPETRKDNTVDNYFGTEVADPYRWLEDDRSEETAEWVKQENELTNSYLAEIPFRDKIRNRLETLYNYERMGTPFREGDYIFYSFNNGLQNQDVIYIKKSPDAEGEVFLDPNKLSDEGTAALTSFSVSNDAEYVGYGIARAGSDWNEFFIMKTSTGEKLNDHLKWIKFSGLSWYRDGFYYSRYAEPTAEDQLKGENKNNMLYYHKAGTPQEKDKLIYKDPEHPGWSFGAQVSDDEQHLVISVVESTTGSAVYYKDLSDENSEIIKIVDNFDSDYSFIGNDGNRLYFLSNLDAPMYRLISIDAENASSGEWKTLIPENPSQVLKSCRFAGNHILALYEKEANSLLEVYDMDGNKTGKIDLPGVGTVGSISAKKKYDDFYYTYTSFNVPAEIHHYKLKTGESELYFRPEVQNFNPDDYVTEQVFYESKDGTKIPMFLAHKKDLKKDGKRPTLLYGYGGFNITYSPVFSVRNLIWMENDGIFALAGIRGGGEYGEEWHKAGMVLNKQNVFDDFIAAGKYLDNSGYTSPGRLTIMGGSNGGLLVGAVINQEPELFAVALPAVGVMDMLRFHKFTIGRYWVSDYGSSEDSVQFEYIYKYSPLHNISSEKNYPAVLVSTADHDDRVVPAHSFKYIATLQEKYHGKNPVLIRIETDAGHGAGKPVSKTIDEYADKWAFAFYNMDFVPDYE